VSEPAETPTPQPPNEGLMSPEMEQQIDKVLSEISVPLEIFTGSFRTVCRLVPLIADLNRAALVAFMTAEQAHEPIPDVDRQRLAERAEKLWMIMHEQGVACSLAAGDVARNAPMLRSDMEQQMQQIDHDFTDGAIRISTVCKLLNCMSPGILAEADFSNGQSLSESSGTGTSAVAAHMNKLTPEQADRLDLFKLVGMVVRRQTVDIEACLMTPEQIVAAQVEMEAMRLEEAIPAKEA
jgi:hypothetical protein